MRDELAIYSPYYLLRIQFRESTLEFADAQVCTAEAPNTTRVAVADGP